MARPRAFDEGSALDKAMEVFWRLGYDGASMSALTGAMGLAAPSVYAAFGSKRGLFDAVLDRYLQRRASYVQTIVAAPTARAAAERMLYGAVDWLTCADEPPGCLLVQAGLASGGETGVPSELAARRGRPERLLRERLARAKADGDLGADADPAELARYVNVVFLGLAVQAGAGAPRRVLRAVATSALAGWPCVKA